MPRWKTSRKPCGERTAGCVKGARSECIRTSFRFRERRFRRTLTMYGGNDIYLFVGYTLPILLLVMAVLVDRGTPRPWELILVFAVLILFNRIGAHIPTYEEDGDGLLDFYGGYGTEVRLRSVLRFAEIWAYVGVFNLLRMVTSRTRPVPRAGLVQ